MPHDHAPVALITGAGSGIGRETALALAAAGHDVALVGRTESTLRATASAVVDARPDRRAEVVVGDLADPDGPADIIARTRAALGRLDVLVNNAALASLAPIPGHDASAIDASLAVNVRGPALLIVAAWPIFVAQGSGCVVNVSSRAASDPFPGFFIYAATKAAQESFVRSIHNEGGEHGIRAYAVAPGAVETEMLRGLFSTDVIPPDAALDPKDVAALITACVRGDREDARGGSIPISAT